MDLTAWYRIVGEGRRTPASALPARAGRFHLDPEGTPTSYLGDSLETVWKEAVAARAGLARPNPRAFVGWRVVLRGSRLVDLRNVAERKRWELSEAELISDPASPRCRDIALAMRTAREVVHGVVYGSVRNAPEGVCLALFLERGAVVARCERVNDVEWAKFLGRIQSKE